MEYLDFIIPMSISTVFIFSYLKIKYSNSILFISIVALLYQFIAIGYKWQNVPYIIICVYLLAKIYFKFQFKSRFINFVLFFAGIVLFLFSLILNYYLPIPSFEFNNSQYSVGYEEVYIEIDNRTQPKAFIELSNLSDGGNRALLVDIYYPSGHHVERAFWIGLFVVDRRRDDAVFEGHDTGQEFDRARATDQVTMHGFGRGHHQFIRMRTKSIRDSRRFRFVVGRRARAMRVDIANILRVQPRILERA